MEIKKIDIESVLACCLMFNYGFPIMQSFVDTFDDAPFKNRTNDSLFYVLSGSLAFINSGIIKKEALIDLEKYAKRLEKYLLKNSSDRIRLKVKALKIYSK